MSYSPNLSNIMGTINSSKNDLSRTPSFALSQRSMASTKPMGPLLATRSAASNKARSHFTPSTCPDQRGFTGEKALGWSICTVFLLEHGLWMPLAYQRRSNVVVQLRRV